MHMPALKELVNTELLAENVYVNLSQSSPTKNLSGILHFVMKKATSRSNFTNNTIWISEVSSFAFASG